MDKILSAAVLRVVEHSSHDIIDRTLQGVQRAGAVPVDLIHIVFEQSLRLRFHIARSPHRGVSCALVGTPVVDVACESQRNFILKPGRDVVLIRACKHYTGVLRKLLESFRRERRLDIRHNSNRLVGARLKHLLCQIAMQNP